MTNYARVTVDAVPETSTPQYSAVLLWRDGTPIEPSDVATATLTLYEERTGNVVGVRRAQDIHNTNGGAFAAAGHFSMLFTALDMTLEDTVGNMTHLIALFIVVRTTGERLVWEIAIPVVRVQSL